MPRGRFEVLAADPENGREQTVTVTATSVSDAKSQVAAMGLLVATAKLTELLEEDSTALARRTPPVEVIERAPPPQPPAQILVQAPPPRIVTPVQVSVRTPHHGSSLGNGAVVLGILAFVICWIPLVGAIGLPLAALGLLLAVLGFFLALFRNGAGAGMCIAGGAVCGLALIVAGSINGALILGPALTRASQAAAKARASSQSAQAVQTTGSAVSRSWTPLDQPAPSTVEGAPLPAGLNEPAPPMPPEEAARIVARGKAQRAEKIAFLERLRDESVRLKERVEKARIIPKLDAPWRKLASGLAFRELMDRPAAARTAGSYTRLAEENLALLNDPKHRWMAVLDTAEIDGTPEPGAIGRLGVDQVRFVKVIDVEHVIVKTLGPTAVRVRATATTTGQPDESDPALGLLTDPEHPLRLSREFVIVGLRTSALIPGAKLRTVEVFEVLSPDRYPADIGRSERLVLRRIVPPDDAWLP